MSKVTIILSYDSEPVANELFDDYIKSCYENKIMVRCEPYTSDMYKELNDKALEIERNQALTELEEEILNNVACVGGSCED